MKNSSFLYTALLCSASLLSFPAQAKPANGNEPYSPNKTFQQACHGKSEGAPVSMALNGVIFNGTCQVMLVPTNRSVATRVEDAALVQACAGKANERVTATLNGQEVKGKCALSFHSIEPAAAP